MGGKKPLQERPLTFYVSKKAHVIWPRQRPTKSCWVASSESLLGDIGGDMQPPDDDLTIGDVIGTVHAVPPGERSTDGIVTTTVRPWKKNENLKNLFLSQVETFLCVPLPFKILIVFIYSHNI